MSAPATTLDTAATVHSALEFEREWTAIAVPHTDYPWTSADWRRHRILAENLHRSCREATTEFVVVYVEQTPSDELIDLAIGALDESEPSSTEQRSTGPADICIADDGSDPLLATTWQMLAQRGLATVTIRAHRDLLDRRESGPRPGEHPLPEYPMMVVRRSAVVDAAPGTQRTAWRRPSWWAAALTVCAFAIWNLVQIGRDSIALDGTETLWLDAARSGSLDGVAGTSTGSGFWPALMEPVLGGFGVSGVRIVALCFAVGAVLFTANAASRLFGRWAARSTAVAMVIAMTISGVAIDATPTTLVLLALALTLQGIALAVDTTRPSWLILSAASSSLAVAVHYRSFIVVVALVVATALLGGRRWRANLASYTVTWLACTAWWSVRVDRPPASVLGPADPAISGSTVGLVVVIAVAIFAVARFSITVAQVRRRVLALGLAAAVLPVARLVVDMALDDTDVAIAACLLAPVVGAVVAHVAAWIAAGEQIEPAQRTAPDLLKVDPSTGTQRGGQVRFKNRQMYLAGVLLVLSSLWFFPWAIGHMAWETWWLALPFLVCNAMVALIAGLMMYNNARQSIPLEIRVAAGHEPLVGVIVPVVDEPIEMVDATIRSIIDQDWPTDRLRVVVSDDGHDDAVRDHFEALAATLPDRVLTYYRPPERGSIGRAGDSKAGNLNAAVLVLTDAHCEYVEVRDADDLVGCHDFLRSTIGYMMADERVAYVQTIKESRTNGDDPYETNSEVLFHRGMTLARNVHHAALPSGSGLIWRRAALREIGHFPAFNLVEDIHSGILAMRAGWRGLFVPVVGSFAQRTPDEIPGYFEQRSTWALDSIRLVMLDRLRGIPWRTRLQLLEQTAFYLLSVPVMGLLFVPMFGLAFGRSPIDADRLDYALHFVGFAVSVELCMFAFASGQLAHAYIKARLFVVGMAPLYAASVLRAAWYGALRAPIYAVPRQIEHDEESFRKLKVHWLLIALILGSLLLAVLRRDGDATFDPGNVYWAFAGIAGLASFVRLGSFGSGAADHPAAPPDEGDPTG